jgi:UDP-glucose 4-epimerase
MVDYYLSEGHEVTILDNMSTGSTKNIEHVKNQIEIHQGDIRDVELVNKLVSKSDLVLHMAAALGVNTILESTVESVSTNFTGSEVVINAALENDKRILIASTSEVYGKNPKQPLSETDDRVVGPPQKIRWTYSDAKALEEAVAHSLYLEKGLQVTTVRFFNTVGPRQTGRYGMVVPRFVKSAIENKNLQVYGDGTQSRVFGHVSDAVDAVSGLIKNEKSIGEVFNIGGIGEVTIRDLANIVISQTGSRSEIEFIPYEKAYAAGYEDMSRRVPNIQKVSNLLNWKPQRNLSHIINDVANSL